MIDLLDLIAAKLKFDYTVYEVEDKKYGSEIEPGKWNGMVGELMHRDSEKVKESLTYEQMQRFIPCLPQTFIQRTYKLYFF